MKLAKRTSYFKIIYRNIYCYSCGTTKPGIIIKFFDAKTNMHWTYRRCLKCLKTEPWADAMLNSIKLAKNVVCTADNIEK